MERKRLRDADADIHDVKRLRDADADDVKRKVDEEAIEVYVPDSEDEDDVELVKRKATVEVVADVKRDAKIASTQKNWISRNRTLDFTPRS